VDDLADFVGEIEQIPPMFSAVKREGVPLHRLAREGRVVERQPKRVRIARLDLLKYEPPELEIAVICSQGTYVRALAADVGARLGCGAHLAGLRRTRSGPFELAQAASAEDLAAEAARGGVEARIIPAVNVLGLPVLRLSVEEARRVGHGGEIPAPEPPLSPGARLAALEPAGALIAVLEVRPGRRLKPLRVLRSLAPPG
jgi:tRNA pseudouridine55 synthase